MAFPQFRLENGKIVSGVIVNPDTVLVLLNPRETTAPETLTLVVSENGLFREAQKATRLGGGDRVEQDIVYFKDFGKEHYIQIYKLASKIEGILDIEFSELDSDDRRDPKKLVDMKYVDPVPVEGRLETYDVQVVSRSSRREFYIKEKSGVNLKKGGALLDLEGKLFGIVTELMTPPMKFACGPGPLSAMGLIISYQGNLDLLKNAKAGFPTYAERQVMKNFRETYTAFMTKYRGSADGTLAGLNVSIDQGLNQHLILNIATSICSLHFNSYSEISYENLRSSDLELGSVYFASRRKTRLAAPEIEILNKIHKCMKSSRPWLPSKESDIVGSFAAALEGYAKEQSSSP